MSSTTKEVKEVICDRDTFYRVMVTRYPEAASFYGDALSQEVYEFESIERASIFWYDARSYSTLTAISAYDFKGKSVRILSRSERAQKKDAIHAFAMARARGPESLLN